MKSVGCLMLVVLFSLALLPSAAAAQDSQRGGGYIAVQAYDPARNAEKDLAEAQAEAKRTGKNVLVEVGGKWCVWCRILEKFFQQQEDVAALRDKGFVTVAVNFSPENKNTALLGRYPKIPGYPHLFVLDATGRLLQSQNTSELEQGRGYNKEKIEAFLMKWSPKAGDASRAGQ